MYDFHYDLLTKIYISYLENDFSYIEKFCNNYNLSNVIGVIANLSFMSQEEMKNEYHPLYLANNLTEMFSISTSLAQNLINENIKVIYSIEGCDYLESIDEIDNLYNIGLKAIAPVWNEPNKFGSGNRSDKGLTEEGKKLIEKAIDIGIAIDLSHTNTNTFNDILNIIKEKSSNHDVVFFASHSNCKKLCNRDRNLTDDQLLKIKELNGYVGIFSNKNFVTLDKNKTKEQLINDYVNHIKYISNLFKGVDNIVLSTDDMNFCSDKDSDYIGLNIFPYESIKDEIKCVLLKNFSEEETNKILYTNGQKIFNKIMFKEVNNKKSIYTNACS